MMRRRTLLFVLLAPVGPIVAAVLTVVKRHYDLGDTWVEAKIVELWVASAAWVVAWCGAAYAIWNKDGRS